MPDNEPKATPDYAGLIERLEGIYRVPITDGLGAVGTGEEPDNPNEFVRKFETAPIQKEAATALRTLLESNAALERERDSFKTAFLSGASLRASVAEAERDGWRISFTNAAADRDKAQRELKAAEAERDRLAERVAELERERTVELEELDRIAFSLSDMGRIEDGNAVIAAAVEIANLRSHTAASGAHGNMVADSYDGYWVKIFATGDGESTPAEAIHHGLAHAHNAGFIDGWGDPCSEKGDA